MIDDWKPLSEVLKTQKFDDLIRHLKNGTVKARGDFETDQMYEERRVLGIASCDEDENFPKNIQEIASDCWGKYKFNSESGILSYNFGSIKGDGSWNCYSDIEISPNTPTQQFQPKISKKRNNFLHQEIERAYSTYTKGKHISDCTSNNYGTLLKKIKNSFLVFKKLLKTASRGKVLTRNANET